MIRLCEIGLMYFLAPKAMWLLLKIHPNEILELDTISNTLLFDSRVWILPVICLLFMAFFYLLDKKGKYATNVMVVIRNIFYGLVAAGVLFGHTDTCIECKRKAFRRSSDDLRENPLSGVGRPMGEWTGLYLVDHRKNDHGNESIP